MSAAIGSVRTRAQCATVPDKRAHAPAPDYALCLDQAIRRELIRRAAYFRSERRGFAPGHEVDDWVQAEREVNEALAPQWCES